MRAWSIYPRVSVLCVSRAWSKLMEVVSRSQCGSHEGNVLTQEHIVTRLYSMLSTIFTGSVENYICIYLQFVYIVAIITRISNSFFSFFWILLLLLLGAVDLHLKAISYQFFALKLFRNVVHAILSCDCVCKFAVPRLAPAPILEHVLTPAPESALASAPTAPTSCGILSCPRKAIYELVLQIRWVHLTWLPSIATVISIFFNVQTLRISRIKFGLSLASHVPGFCRSCHGRKLWKWA